MIALFQTASDVKEIVTIESVSAIGVLLLFITYLIWQNHLLKNKIEATEVKIDLIVKEHMEDVRNGNKDVMALVEKYHLFVEQLKNFSSSGR